MKSDKTIFLVISVLALIAVTGYATPTIDDRDVGDHFDHKNISLYIDDRQILQGGGPAVNFGTYEFVVQFNMAESKANYTSDIKIFSAKSLQNDAWKYNGSNNLSIASTSFAILDAHCTRDKSPELLKGKHDGSESADMDLLAAELSKIEDPGGTVNLFWTLSDNKGVPSTNQSAFGFRD